MKELVLDKDGRVICYEENSVKSLNSFLEKVDSQNLNNSIALFSKDTYLVKMDDEEYFLSSYNPKAKRKLNKLCKRSNRRENLKKSLGLSYIDSENMGKYLKNAKADLSSSNKSYAKSILDLLIGLGFLVYSLGGGPLLLYLFLSGAAETMHGVSVALTALGLAPSAVIDIIFLSELIDDHSICSDVIGIFKEPFKNLSEEYKERKLNASNLRELKALSKKMELPQIEKPKEVIVPIDDKIGNIIQGSSGLDTRDRKLILEDLKNIIEKYNVNDKETKKQYYKSAEAQAKLVDELKALESNISLLIRRKNLEKTVFDCSAHEEIVTPKEEEGPVRKLTPQN